MDDNFGFGNNTYLVRKFCKERGIPFDAEGAELFRKHARKKRKRRKTSDRVIVLEENTVYAKRDFKGYRRPFEKSF